MSKKIKKVPKKQTVSISKFLSDYVEAPPYKGREKLTHAVMIDHLENHYIRVPRRLCFQRITEEDIRTGRVVYVRDKKGYKIPYENPRRVKEQYLSYYLDSKTPEELAKIRKRLLHEVLMESGFVQDDLGNIVSLEELYYEELEEKYKVKKKDKKVVYIKSKLYRNQRREK